MIIQILFPCIVLSCLVISCLHAKPFSLNALIEAEEKQKSLTTTTPRVESETSNRFSLKKIWKTKLVKPKKIKRKNGLFANPLHLKTYSKEKETPKVEKTTKWPLAGKYLAENNLSKGRKISSLQYRKTFQIKSPLKPKKLKYIQKRGHRNQSTKREINEDEKLYRKYMPLLRSLDMLFNNILGKGSGDSHEATRISFRRNHHSNFTKGNTTCTCYYTKPDTDVAESATTKATVITTTASDKVTTTEPARTEVSSSGAYNITASNVSSVGQNSDVPSIPAGDTVSTRRDVNGVCTGSRPTLHSSAEGNISGDHRNSEYYTRSGENSARAKNYEKDTHSPPRDDASSARFGRGDPGDGPDSERPVYRRGLYNTHYSTKSEKSFRNTGRDFVKSKRKDQFEDRGNKTESSEFIPKYLRGVKGVIPEDSVDYNPEPLQPEENNEEGDKSVELYVSGDQRFAVGSGPPSSKDQKANETNTATMISIDDLNNNSFIMLPNSPKHKAPYVTIFDGYSVARDKNGANKLAEQSIRVHTK